MSMRLGATGKDPKNHIGFFFPFPKRAFRTSFRLKAGGREIKSILPGSYPIVTGKGASGGGGSENERAPPAQFFAWRKEPRFDGVEGAGHDDGGENLEV